MLAPIIGLSVGLLASPADQQRNPRPITIPRALPDPPAADPTVWPSRMWIIGHGQQRVQSGFTMTTSAGQKVTVDETSTMKCKKGSSSISANAIKKGDHVLVLGTVNSTTIKATQVIVESGGSAASPAANGGPFPKGCSDHLKAGR
jgi:membrane-bound inhibitor of C-type lysozyme